MKRKRSEIENDDENRPKKPRTGALTYPFVKFDRPGLVFLGMDEHQNPNEYDQKYQYLLNLRHPETHWLMYLCIRDVKATDAALVQKHCRLPIFAFEPPIPPKVDGVRPRYRKRLWVLPPSLEAFRTAIHRRKELRFMHEVFLKDVPCRLVIDVDIDNVLPHEFDHHKAVVDANMDLFQKEYDRFLVADLGLQVSNDVEHNWMVLQAHKSTRTKISYHLIGCHTVIDRETNSWVSLYYADSLHMYGAIEVVIQRIPEAHRLEVDENIYRPGGSLRMFACDKRRPPEDEEEEEEGEGEEEEGEVRDEEDERESAEEDATRHAPCRPRPMLPVGWTRSVLGSPNDSPNDFFAYTFDHSLLQFHRQENRRATVSVVSMYGLRADGFDYPTIRGKKKRLPRTRRRAERYAGDATRGGQIANQLNSLAEDLVRALLDGIQKFGGKHFKYLRTILSQEKLVYRVINKGKGNIQVDLNMRKCCLQNHAHNYDRGRVLYLSKGIWSLWCAGGVVRPHHPYTKLRIQVMNRCGDGTRLWFNQKQRFRIMGGAENDAIRRCWRLLFKESKKIPVVVEEPVDDRPEDWLVAGGE